MLIYKKNALALIYQALVAIHLIAFNALKPDLGKAPTAVDPCAFQGALSRRTACAQRPAMAGVLKQVVAWLALATARSSS